MRKENTMRPQVIFIQQPQSCGQMSKPKLVCISVRVLTTAATLTDLMRHRECGVKPVILNDGAASLWRADSADVCHSQGVTGVMAAEVLKRWYTKNLKQPKDLSGPSMLVSSAIICQSHSVTSILTRPCR